MASTRRSRRCVAGALAATMLGAGVLAALPMSASAAPSAGDPGDAVLRGRCLDPGVELSVEEARLTARLPDPADPSRLASTTFARQMVTGGGFDDVAPAFVHRLCGTRNHAAAQRLIAREGRALWRQAVARAQDKPGARRGDLPASDDRPLYWTRLQVTAALRQWQPRFDLGDDERSALITAFDKASRGMTDIDFPAGHRVKRVLLSGFDPYTLDGGPAGTASGAAGNNIRHGNPSGATALAVDGTVVRGPNGTKQVVQAYVLPVNYTEFAAGYIEDTVGPWMRAGRRALTASITVSQGSGDKFDLEQWNGRYHGVSPGNDKSHPCPAVDGVPQLAKDNPGCNTQIVPRWGGPARFDPANPPQWTATSLPIEAMTAAKTGHGIPRPPGDTWPDEAAAFGVIWNTKFIEFPDCASTTRVTRNDPVPTTYPPATPPTPPSPGSCAYSGGGGTYLSNESAYRNTLLRDRLGRDIPAGHIHTPVMQHFEEGNLYAPSDAVFDQWRRAIVAQTVRLVHVVGAQS